MRAGTGLRGSPLCRTRRTPAERTAAAHRETITHASHKVPGHTWSQNLTRRFSVEVGDPQPHPESQPHVTHLHPNLIPSQLHSATLLTRSIRAHMLTRPRSLAHAVTRVHAPSLSCTQGPPGWASGSHPVGTGRSCSRTAWLQSLKPAPERHFLKSVFCTPAHPAPGWMGCAPGPPSQPPPLRLVSVWRCEPGGQGQGQCCLGPRCVPSTRVLGNM